MFRDILSKVLRHVKGALGCVLIGADGIPVEQVTLDGQDEQIEAIAVEMNDVVNRLRRAVVQLRVGPVADITIRMTRVVVTAAAIGEEYMILLILSPDADPVRARGMLGLMVPRILKEM